MGWFYQGSLLVSEKVSKTFTWAVPDDALVPTVALEVDLIAEFGQEIFDPSVNLYRVLFQSNVTRAPQPPSVTRREPVAFNSFYPAVQIFLTDENDNITGLIEQRFQSIILPYVTFCQSPANQYGASVNIESGSAIGGTALGSTFALKVQIFGVRGAQGTLSAESFVIGAFFPSSSGDSVNYVTRGGLGSY